jgi:hypothetical protein
MTFAPQVALQALYEQVGTSLLNVRALHTLHLRAVWTTTTNESEEGPRDRRCGPDLVRDRH